MWEMSREDMESVATSIPFPLAGGRYDCMDAGGRTTPGAVVEDGGRLFTGCWHMLA